MTALAFPVAMDYVKICTVTLNPEQFSQILSKKVKLFHQTNEEEPVLAEGRTVVSDLFNKYIFSNSTAIDVRKCNFSQQGAKILLELEVTESKKEDDKVNRYAFKERTFFGFKEKKNNSLKISSIITNVERNPIIKA